MFGVYYLTCVDRLLCHVLWIIGFSTSLYLQGSRVLAKVYHVHATQLGWKKGRVT